MEDDPYPAERIKAFIHRIIDYCGPRIAGSRASHKAAKIIEWELQQYCDETARERFHFHPGAFSGIFRASVIVCLTAAIFLVFNFDWPALILYLIAIAMIASQLFFFRNLFDPFFGRKLGANVYGWIEPQRETRQQLIFSAHHDSARIYRYIKKPDLYRIILMLYIFVILGSAISSAYLCLNYFFFGKSNLIIDALRYGTIFSVVLLLPVFFFLKRDGSPGAGDNLASVAIISELAKLIQKANCDPGTAFNFTRFIFASFDAEEEGLRGSEEWVKRHREELKAVPTWVFNMDAIYSTDDLKILTSDINGLQPLSSRMAAECQTVARDIGIKTATKPIRFASGATDAGEFARAGVPSISIVAIPSGNKDKNIVYHTADDLPGAVEDSALVATLKLAGAYARMKEEQLLSLVKLAAAFETNQTNSSQS